MKRAIKRGLLAVFAFLVLVVVVLGVRWYRRANQVADPNFNATVAHPAYLGQHPKVLFDEAHHNFHTADGRYKPFVDLITNDGYRVSSNRLKFNGQTLEGYNVLVIANAMGAILPILPGARKPAFTEQECDAVREWVHEGGSLLLIADHDPAGGAAEILAKRFGVDMSKGHTFDRANYEEIGGTSWLVFSSENHLLDDDAITQGRDASERIKRVIAFTGQSLKGPEGSMPFLRLADTAYDLLPSGQRVSASGRAVGIALQFGKGRVVVLGEAAMMTAQLAGTEKFAFGMNYPGTDDRQLALNIMHWLSGALNLALQGKPNGALNGVENVEPSRHRQEVAEIFP